jgi:hypothetical protein
VGEREKEVHLSPSAERVTDSKTGLVKDCTLPSQTFTESLLDRTLLRVFRQLVQQEIRFVSPTPGIKGLVEEARHYMLSDEGQQGDGENQHRFVRNVLHGLMSPLSLPPLYRLFMAGIVPRRVVKFSRSLSRSFFKQQSQTETETETELEEDSLQLGPLPFAPYLTSLIAANLMSFLVGPCEVNYRKDGSLGGMLVKKCKFLQVG